MFLYTNHESYNISQAGWGCEPAGFMSSILVQTRHDHLAEDTSAELGRAGLALNKPGTSEETWGRRFGSAKATDTLGRA